MNKGFIKTFAALALAVAVMLACGLSACGGTDYSVMPDAVKKVYDNTFVVNCRDTGQTATGFVYTYYEGDPVAITNYHTLAKTSPPYAAYEAEVVLADGSRCGAELMGWSEYHDVALLRLDGGEFYDFAENSAFAEAEDGDFLCSVGNEYGGGKLVYSAGESLRPDDVVRTDKKGRYSATGTTYKYVPVHTISCSVERGMSGCPIADENGCIVAVGTYREDVRLNKKYYAVPIKFALAAAERITENYSSGAVGEISLFGNETYSAFLASDAKELAVLCNYYSWTDDSKKLAEDGFTCVYVVGGFAVTRTGENCPLEAGDVITSVDGIKYGSASELLYALYGRYEYGGDGKAAEFALSDGRKVTTEISAKID